MREGACALDLDVQPCDADSRGTSAFPCDRGLAVATNMYTPKNGGSHIQHRLSLMLIMSLFISNVWFPCKLFLFVVIIIDC